MIFNICYDNWYPKEMCSMTRMKCINEVKNIHFNSKEIVEFKSVSNTNNDKKISRTLIFWKLLIVEQTAVGLNNNNYVHQIVNTFPVY